MAVVEDVMIEPGGVLAREIRKGQTIRIADLDGQQVGDLVAFSLHDLSERFWISNTIRLNGTIYLTAGHVLYSELSRPMLKLTVDTCGRHDLLAGSCSAEIDKVRHGVEDHRGYVENLVSALAEMDLLLALSNCPQDLKPCNGGSAKPLGFQILTGAPSARDPKG